MLVVALVSLAILGQAPIEPLTINTPLVAPETTADQTGPFDRFIQSIFEPVGYRVVVQHPPAERSLRNVVAGIDDGDGPRIGGMEDRYPGLVRVPESLFDFAMVAFAVSEQFEVHSWAALKPYHVGIVRGWKILEERITGTRSLVRASTPANLFRMLALGRVDVAVIDRAVGEALIAELKIRGARALEPPLAVRPMFLYLNASHARLAPKLAESIRVAKATAVYARVRQERHE